jgi:hypothetical protein
MKIETVKVIIGDLEFYLRYSNRATLLHYNRVSKEPDNVELLFLYVYDLAKAGAETEGKKFDYTYEAFCNAIDPYTDAIPKFNAAVSQLYGEAGVGKKQKK